MAVATEVVEHLSIDRDRNGGGRCLPGQKGSSGITSVMDDPDRQRER